MGPGMGELFVFSGSGLWPTVPVTVQRAPPSIEVEHAPFAIGPERRERIAAQGDFSIELSALFARRGGLDLSSRGAEGLRHDPATGIAIGTVNGGDADSFDGFSGTDVALVGTIVFSVGLVVWASRSGALLTSVLAITPAWQNFDPLPVLRERDDRHEIRDPDVEPEALGHGQQGDSTQSGAAGTGVSLIEEIGRASCRERV